MVHASNFPIAVNHDLISSLTQQEGGNGSSRAVFIWPLDESLVLKLETTITFQNIIEWETWSALKDTIHSKWLAPCVWISNSGSALLMKRTQSLIAGKEPKVLIPAWLTDTKRSNYGLLNNKLVCHDYGTNLLLNHGAFGGKVQMKKPNWWE